MDVNIEIIRTVFLSAHTAPSLRALSKHYSPNFFCDSQLRGFMNFEQYCQNLALIRANTDIEIESIENLESYYEVKLDVAMIYGDVRKITKFKAWSHFYFKGNIIQSIVSKFTATPKQTAYMHKSIVPFSVTI